MQVCNTCSMQTDTGCDKKIIDNRKRTFMDKLQNKWMDLSPYTLDELSITAPDMLENGTVLSLKCERIHERQRLWEVEIALQKNNKGLLLPFLIYDQISRAVHLPIEVPEKILCNLVRSIESCITAPHLKLGEKNRGLLFDNDLIQDIKANFEAYVWERMYPGTVFSTLSHFTHHMQRYRFVKNHIDNADVIVDAACGIGYGAKFLSQKCSKVVGVDLSARSLDMARRFYSARNIHWLQSDAAHLPFENGSIDGFVSMETFEHLDSPHQLVAEIRRVVKQGGMAFVSTPNGLSPKRKRINNPYHIKEYGCEEVKEICSKYFNTIQVFGVDLKDELSPIDNAFEQYDNLVYKLR